YTCRMTSNSRIKSVYFTGKLVNYCSLISLQILLLPTLLLLLTSLLLIVKIPITAFHIFISLLITVALSKVFPPGPGKLNGIDFIKATALFLIILAASFFISKSIYDFSWDGMAYHQPGIIALAEGWNPFHQPVLESFNELYHNQPKNITLPINHFTKASWITAASVYKATGHLEPGKMFHILYMAALFLVAVRFLSYFKRIAKTSNITISLLAALNPVAICQVFSFYNDGQLYSLTAIVILLSLQYLFFKDKKAIMFSLVVIPTLSNI
ncbi:MAG: hypothetical protein GY757_22410, partial [bacterium]|nr:hypothetical protein [bacterium]